MLFDKPTVVWCPLETRIIDLHIAADSLGLSSFSFFLVGSFKRFFSQIVAIVCILAVQGHPRSLFLVQIESACATHSNLGPILHRFEYCGILCSWPHPFSTPILGVFLSEQIGDLGVSHIYAQTPRQSLQGQCQWENKRSCWMLKRNRYFTRSPAACCREDCEMPLYNLIWYIVTKLSLDWYMTFFC